MVVFLFCYVILMTKLCSPILQCLMGGWLFHYSYKCQPVDYSDNPVAIRVSFVIFQ